MSIATASPSRSSSTTWTSASAAAWKASRWCRRQDARAARSSLLAMHPNIYMPMLRHRRSGGQALWHQPRGAGRISLSSRRCAPPPPRLPASSTMKSCLHRHHGVVNKETKEVSHHEVTAHQGRRQPPRNHAGRPGQGLKPVMGEGGVITAGNASQLSDGSSACVLMEAKLAEKRGLTPLGRYVGMAVAGTEPDEMGIGPVFAIPKLLKLQRPEDGRHRPVGTERGLRRAGALLPRQAGHSR
jgi:hypothetical protein